MALEGTPGRGGCPIPITGTQEQLQRMLALLLTSPRLCQFQCPHFTISLSSCFWLPGSCTFLHMRSHAGMYQILCDDDA